MLHRTVHTTVQRGFVPKPAARAVVKGEPSGGQRDGIEVFGGFP